MDSAQRAHGETVVLTGIEQTWRSGVRGDFILSAAPEKKFVPRSTSPIALVESQTTRMPARHP